MSGVALRGPSLSRASWRLTLREAGVHEQAGFCLGEEFLTADNERFKQIFLRGRTGGTPAQSHLRSSAFICGKKAFLRSCKPDRFLSVEAGSRFSEEIFTTDEHRCTQIGRSGRTARATTRKHPRSSAFIFGKKVFLRSSKPDGFLSVEAVSCLSREVFTTDEHRCTQIGQSGCTAVATARKHLHLSAFICGEKVFLRSSKPDGFLFVEAGSWFSKEVFTTNEHRCTQIGRSRYTSRATTRKRPRSSAFICGKNTFFKPSTPRGLSFTAMATLPPLTLAEPRT